MMNKRYGLRWILGVFILIMVGCETIKQEYPIKEYESVPTDKIVAHNLDFEREPSVVFEKALTDEKVMSLTFQGMGTEERLTLLLEALKVHQIEATFFVSGIEVAENPELAQMIINHGHQLGNATLSGIDLTTISEDKKITEIFRSHQEIMKHTGVEPAYLRVGQRGVDEEVLSVAGAGGYEYVVDYTINPQDWDGKSAKEIVAYIDRFKQRGSTLILNASKTKNLHEIVPLIKEGLSEDGFEFVSLDTLIELHENQSIPEVTLTDNWYEVDGSQEFLFVEEGDRTQKKIALTFDDWASDETVDAILDTLDEFSVKATFFLIGKGVETNPSLAYTISERGHEVASHTYSHLDLDTLSESEIQEDVIKAHEVISKAIGKEAKRYLRPPRGIMNDEIAKVIKDCNYSAVVMYGPSAWDWDVEKTAKEITDYMLSNTYNGAILLLHILDGIATPEALPDILSGLLAQGYEFVTVGEMIEQ